MPIFEFHCKACSKTFEKLLKTAVERFTCPICGQLARRAVSAPAVAGDAACPAPSGSGFR